MAALRVDSNYFIRRATRIYEAWKQDEILSSVDSLIFMVGESNDEVQYSKSSALQTWLYNCSLPDTLLIMTKSGIHFLGSDRKAQFFSPLDTKENLHPVVPPFTILYRDKKDKDKNNFEKLLDILTAEGKTCGHFAKDKAMSEFAKSWEGLLKGKHQTLVDVSLPFAKLFAVKDEKEIELMKKSALASINAWLFLRKKIVSIVDSEKKVRHSKLCEELEKEMLSVKLQGNLAQSGILESCYSPIIQSGDNCTLKFSAESTEKLIHFDCVVSSMGGRYMSYCTNVGRTLMVMPSQAMEDLYESVLTTELAILEALRPGKKLCDAYNEGLRNFQEKQPDLFQYLVKNSFGFATGIEFRDANLLINEKCQQVVEKGMTFIVTVGLENFPVKGGSFSQTGKAASLYLSDTVLVCDNGPNEILTERAKSRLRANAIRLKADEEVGTSEVETVEEGGRSKRTLVLQEQTRHKQTNEEKRLIHQKELAEQLNREARERLSMNPGAKQAQKAKKSNVSYKSEDKFPDDTEVDRMMVHVDKRNDSIIVPIFGVPVPFHISMIKNISQSVEGDFVFLRINFSHPGSIVGREKQDVPFPNPLLKFIKEMTFKSSNLRESGEVNSPSTNLSTAFRLIKEMQKHYRTQEAEEREKEGALKQDKLITSVGKPNPKLKDLYVRPSIIPKRLNGTLEAHTNGFRFTSIRGDKIDVLYNNIKHAFFQPCDNEMLILLHFHLKYPVLWGKKKHSDIQFFTEVGEVNTDLGKYHHMQDRDDIQSEQMEREMRKKLNLAFETFCDKVRKMTNEAVDFDTPFNELGFSGVPFRSAVTLKPTSTCLVHLTEWPPFVVTLDEIELVHFERVTSNTRSFDMVIVFKDYHRKTQQIGHIPSSSLDALKDWLNSCDIRYSEGPMSLNWNNIMRTILDDPDSFFENGGWKFILEDDEEEEEEEEEEESEFEPSSEDSEEEDEDEEEEEAVTSESESEAEANSDESEGKDWSDLEEEAARADKAKDRGDEDERGRDRKRKGGRGPAPSAKRRK